MSFKEASKGILQNHTELYKQGRRVDRTNKREARD